LLNFHEKHCGDVRSSALRYVDTASCNARDFEALTVERNDIIAA